MVKRIPNFGKGMGRSGETPVEALEFVISRGLSRARWEGLWQPGTDNWQGSVDALNETTKVLSEILAANLAESPELREALSTLGMSREPMEPCAHAEHRYVHGLQRCATCGTRLPAHQYMLVD
jgi:hypothetical protein